ncbi:lantibiotic dehydratase [Streptomyces chrestomyceticus]|uniref:lantibiotic dehydratase n=1 Tax=Streptomyces chrestomyceticus TaxID=68185 RepID=UPI0033DF2F57
MTEKWMPYYRPTGTAMLRASVHTFATALTDWPGPEVDADGARRGWLGATWAQRPVAEAVALASPVLAGQINAVLAGQPTGAGQVRRMTLALARYLVRMRGRATPFGTFAGVSSAHFGPRLTVRWTENHRVRTRTDAGWLAQVIARLEASAQLRRQLPAVLNNLAVQRGGRLIVTCQPHCGVGDSPAEVSVRLIPVVRTVIARTRSPVQVGELIENLSAEHPGASVERLEALVGELMARGVLISSLRPGSTATDPLAHLLDRLHETDAHALSEVHEVVSELRTIHQQLQAADRAPTWSEGRRRRVTTARMRALSGATDQPLAVDLRLGCTLVLPRAVAGEAASAAEALIRLTPAPAGSASWRDYHGRFLDRYGPGTPIALDQLLAPTAGLGFPRHFAPARHSTRELTPRDETLLALAQQAALDGAHEVTLDEQRIDELTGGTGQRPVTPADVWVDIRANTPAALDAGDFTLAVCGFGRRAAHMGRFLDLLHERDRRSATGQGAALATGVHEALAAQLSFPPRQVHQENVQRVAPQLSEVISLAEHGEPSAAQIPVADLAVIADGTRLYVVALSRRRVVEPMLLHSGARHTMPPLARLLLEIPRSAHPQVTAFDWGAAACLPFLPRLRCGRSILACAQWRLAPADLPGPTASPHHWSSTLQTVRAQRGLPAAIAVGSGDRQLRLDLDEPMDRGLLRAHLDAAHGPITVLEAPSAADYGWFDGRAHEIVVPLAATAPPAQAPSFLRGTAPLAAGEPSKDVVYAKLYGPAELFDGLLTEQVPQLLKSWATPPPWWFVRYRHPAAHLRLRVHDADTARAVGAIATWAESLRARGLLAQVSFDSYWPETGRYGSGVAMTAAEELFAADSAAALAQLAALKASDSLHPQALTAASLVDLAAAVTGSTTAGLRWLTDRPHLATPAPMRDREIRQQTLQIANGQLLHRVPGGEAITAAWAARSAAATRYAARLTSQTSHVTPDSALVSLLHMHHIRALGIDTGAEAMTHKLARSVALAQTGRQSNGTGATE